MNVNAASEVLTMATPAPSAPPAQVDPEATAAALAASTLAGPSAIAVAPVADLANSSFSAYA
jgi:hypothetical protein